MEKLLIIDGSALLFQSFYGMPRKIINSKGQRMEAVVCFIGIMIKTIKETNPTQLLIVFDGENKLQRQEIDVNYKANRKDFSAEEENPFAQLEVIKIVLDSLGIKWVETQDCEADDLIASIVNENRERLKITISSNDKDFFQLIDQNVNVFVYRGKVSKLWTSEEFFEKYGFEAKHFSTLKSLMGDAADNIKGVKGIGIKTATKLVQKFASLDNILKNIENIDEKLKNVLKLNQNIIYRNFQLVELHSKNGLYNLQDCKFVQPKDTSTIILKRLELL